MARTDYESVIYKDRNGDRGRGREADHVCLGLVADSRLGVSGPEFAYSDTWQLVINTSTTIVTFLMVFLIQNSQNRDAAAMQAKLDEMIRALDAAREQFIGVEHLTAAEVEKVRSALEQEVGENEPAAGTAHESVKNMQKRRFRDLKSLDRM